MKIVFINSKNYWQNGWLSTAESLQFAMQTLNAAGISTSAIEVSHVSQLEQVLATIRDDTLVWPNAYYVQKSANEVVWMQASIEKYQLPYVGTHVQGLQTMLDKVATHQALQRAAVPVPQYLRITRHNFPQLAQLLAEGNFSWPLVVKPTAESCSMGVIRADNLEQAEQHVKQLFEEFPHSDAFPLSEVIAETFLPSEDITCGYLRLGDEIMLLPTHYMSLKMPGKAYIMERDLGVAPWTGPDIVMPPVTDQDALAQLATYMPPLVSALNITGVTRVDARKDVHGTLRFFDANGMPALSFPKSVLVRQIRECFPETPAQKAYESLLFTLVMMAANQFGLTVPEKVANEHLFNLEGGKVIRFSMEKQEV